MKKILYILFFVSTIFFVGCENALGPQLQDDRVIKTETKWKVSSALNQKIEKVSFKEFNKNGNIIAEINFNQQSKEVISSNFEYFDGRRIEHEYKISNNGDTTQILIHNYEVNNGKVTKKTTKTIDGQVINSEQFSYDVNGNLTEMTQCLDDGNCNNTIKYDNQYVNGSLTVRYTLENDGTVTQKDSIVYGSMDNYFEKITSDNAGNVYFITSYNIDDNGNVKSETIKSSKGEIIDKYIYEFTYFD